jgi:acetamidase/formamidase
MSPFHDPKLVAKPADTVVVETEDAFSGQIRAPTDKRDFVKMPFSNPLSGPIYVEGAEQGDTLTVTIMKIECMIGQGATYIASCMRYLSSIPFSPLLGADLPDRTLICPIRDGKIRFNDKIALPYEPMIGTIGVAPRIEALSSRFAGPHGGNIDIPEVSEGNRIYFPVYVKGALLYLGDAHAVQGDGESPGGVAIEMPAVTTLKVDLIKTKAIRWPRLETSDYVGVIVSTGTRRNMEDAVKIAFIELVFWLETEYGLDRWDAYQLCTQVSKVRLGNLWTIAAMFPKRYL